MNKNNSNEYIEIQLFVMIHASTKFIMSLDKNLKKLMMNK